MFSKTLAHKDNWQAHWNTQDIANYLWPVLGDPMTIFSGTHQNTGNMNVLELFLIYKLRTPLETSGQLCLTQTLMGPNTEQGSELPWLAFNIFPPNIGCLLYNGDRSVKKKKKKESIKLLSSKWLIISIVHHKKREMKSRDTSQWANLEGRKEKEK